MKPRRLLPLLALLGCALGLGACNAGLSGDPAQVSGSSVSQSELDSTLSALSSNSGFTCVVLGGSGKSTAGKGDSYSTAFAAQILTTLVEVRALESELARRHLQLDAFSRSVGTSELEQALAPGGSSDQSCTTPAAAILAEMPSDVRGRLVDLQAAQDLLAADGVHVTFSPSGVDAWAHDHPELATLTCLSVAAFPSKATAASFSGGVRGGTSFDSLAAKDGTQAQAGCLEAGSLPGALPATLQDLRAGEVSPPVSYNGGWLVIQLTSRHLASGQEAAGLLMNSTASSVSKIVASALASVQVTVDPAYGSWKKVSETYQVVPPKAPTAGLLINPAAVGLPTAAASG